MALNLEDRYALMDSAHGKGGFGKIEIHKDKVLDRTVAIKNLLWLEDEDSKMRFRKEAKILASMSHPNIPAIYDVNFSDEEMVIIFEYIEGDNLRKILMNEITSMEDARRWFIQIGSALEYSPMAL